MKILLLTVSLFLTLFSCKHNDETSRYKVLTALESEDLLADATFFYDSLVSKEKLELLIDEYDEACVLLSSNGQKYKGKQAIYLHYKEFFKTVSNVIYHSEIDEITSKDNWAMEKSRYSCQLTTVADNERHINNGRHIIFRKKNRTGNWKITYESWTIDGSMALNNSTAVNLENTR